MAGDWIKMRVDLADDPAVIGIALDLGIDEDAVVGKLWKLWSWANCQTCDGNAPGVRVAWVDRYLRCEGFAAAMIRYKWLLVTDDGIRIPNFERHNGKSAKQRALTSERVAKFSFRNAASVSVPEKTNAGSVSVPLATALPREEKRREDKETPQSPPSGGGDVPEQKPPQTDEKQPQYPADFEAFWEAYPRKEAKGAALRAWQKLKSPRTLLPAILDAIDWQKVDGCLQPKVSRDGRSVIPHPATWLNARHWEDERLRIHAEEYDPVADRARIDAQVRAMREEDERSKAKAVPPPDWFRKRMNHG